MSAPPVRLKRRALLGLLAGGGALSTFGIARAASAARLITLGAPTTEIVFALGGGEAVVGTDTTSRFPAVAAGLPKVGYMRAVSAEGLLSLRPTLVLAQADSGPPEVLEQIRQLGVAVELIPERPDLEGLLGKIRRIGALLERTQQAERLAADLAGRLAPRPVAGTVPAVLCVIHAGGGNPMAAGQGTVPDTLIRLAGARNAAEAMTGFKPLTPEAAIAAAPAALLVSAATIAQAGGLDALLAQPHLAPTPAAHHRRVVTVYGSLLLGLGPRSPEAVDGLAAALAGADAPA